MALGIGCYQLSLPYVLFGIHGFTGNGYDDGVYLGVATRLVHGVIPYRDFDFVQPPGIAILMSPVALIGRVIGTRDAMAVARCLTAAVTALNAGLAAFALRDRGRAAMLVAGVALALFPLAVAADQSLLLEPYLVCFCLLGVIALFTQGRIASQQRVVLAGLAIGFAGSIKLWAVLPAVAAILACTPVWKRGVRPLILGLVLGFVVPSVAFVLLAPSSFVHDVFISQIHRGTEGVEALSIPQRLLQITGLSGLPNVDATTAWAVILTVGLAMVAIVIYLTTWRRRTRLDWFVLLAAAIVVLGMFSSPEFYDHYAYFPAAFLALLLGVCMSQLYIWIRLFVAPRVVSRSRVVAGISIAACAVVVVAALALVVGQDTSNAASYLSSSADPAATVEAQIPEGSCVVFDYAIFAINANRFNPSSSNCPGMVDPFGMWLSRDNGAAPPAPPPFPQAFVAAWQGWLNQADYVVLSIPLSDYIPWTPKLIAAFHEQFHLVASLPRVYVYERSTNPVRSQS